MPDGVTSDELDVFEFPPSRNGMPALEGDYAPNLLARYSTAIAVGGMEWLGYQEHWLTANLARLTDKAIREYDAARECVDEYLAYRSESDARSGPIDIGEWMLMEEERSALYTAADRLENCINALRRADLFLRTAVFADVIAATGYTYPPPYLDELHEAVQRIRNRIEHAHEDLEEGKIPAGQPLFVAVGSDGISFSGQNVLYAEIAALIVTIWTLTNALIEAGSTEVDAAVDAGHAHAVQTPVQSSEPEKRD